MIKAVIFDMDGVLIDSEIIYLNHIYDKLKRLYLGISREELSAVVGATSKKTREIISRLIGADVDSPDFKDLYTMLWADCRLDYPAILRKEVPELLEEIRRRGCLVALASSTRRAGIEKALTSCGLKDHFDYIVSGEEFKESKPNPEIYLHTADTLKCEPAECLVVEDSPYGIMAGHDAGMTVTALIDERFNFDQSLADYSIQGLGQVLDILEELNK